MDFGSMKKLTVGGVALKQLLINGIRVWKAITYKNWVPVSTDTDGSIYNGVGYKDNVRLSSSGGISGSAQNGSTTTGFIPFHGDEDIVRIKGVEWLNTYNSGHHYLNFYDSSKKFLDYTSSTIYSAGNMGHVLTVTRDAQGVETIVWNRNYGTTNTLLQNVRKASYMRITARGKGADMIVTVNEEIVA